MKWSSIDARRQTSDSSHLSTRFFPLTARINPLSILPISLQLLSSLSQLLDFR